MNPTIRRILLAVVVLSICVVGLQQLRVRPGKQSKAPSDTSARTSAAVQTADNAGKAVDPRERARFESGVFSLWMMNGPVDPDAARFYRFTADQVARLNQLHVEIVRRLEQLERSNGELSISPDRQHLTLSVRANPEAAREFAAYYSDSLRSVLGESDFEHYVKHSQDPFIDDFSAAGSLDKNLTVLKQVTADGVRYEVNVDRRYTVLVDPSGTPVGATSHASGTVARDQLVRFSAWLPQALPSDF